MAFLSGVSKRFVGKPVFSVVSICVSANLALNSNSFSVAVCVVCVVVVITIILVS